MEKSIDIGGVRVHYEEWQGTEENLLPIVFVHGYLSSLVSFKPLISRIGSSRRIFALDLPGFGKSEKSKKFIYSLENYAEFLLEFLDRIGLEKVVIAAHSMGAQICLKAARLAPERFEKMVLMSAAGYMGRLKRSFRLLTLIPGAPAVLNWHFSRRDTGKDFELVVHNPDIITEAWMESYLRPMRDRHFFSSLLRLARHREGDLNTDEVKKIDVPVLLMWGREDRIVPLEIGKRFESDLPRAALVIFEETGHLLPEERPAVTAKTMMAFINQKSG